MITVTYACGGCAEVATRTAESAYEDLGSVTRIARPTIRSTAPEGWVPIDPYTGACYCPTCWTSIEAAPTEALCPGSGRPLIDDLPWVGVPGWCPVCGARLAPTTAGLAPDHQASTAAPTEGEA